MTMPKIAIAYGVLLVLLGAGSYALAAADVVHVPPSPTAFIPSYIGLVFVVLGVASIAKDALRKHLMHAAAALALLAALMGLFMSLKSLLGAGFDFGKLGRPLATTAQLIMGVLSVGFVVLCVKSFRDARRKGTV